LLERTGADWVVEDFRRVRFDELQAFFSHQRRTGKSACATQS
jgi:hypothetical protein